VARKISARENGIRRVLRSSLAALSISLALALPAAAAELKQKTIEAYERYVRQATARMERELGHRNPFLWVDTAAEPRRKALLEQLRRGEVVIERLHETGADGQALKAPDGLIHHWVGVVFIPGAKLADVLALVQDYDRHQEIYKPDVLRSRTLARAGDDFKIHLRFLKKKVITVVVDTDHDVNYRRISPARAASHSRTTRVLEVENHGKPGERHKPEGNDGGFLWRLDTFWRFDERDGGTYVQCESVSLTRDIPTGLGWIVGPFVNSVPRESLVFTLGTTRTALLRSGHTAND
jgi:hypothetical protein